MQHGNRPTGSESATTSKPRTLHKLGTILHFHQTNYPDIYGVWEESEDLEENPSRSRGEHIESMETTLCASLQLNIYSTLLFM